MIHRILLLNFAAIISDAVRRNAISYLRSLGETPVYPGYTGNGIAYALENGPETFDNLKIEKFYRAPNAVLKYCEQAKVGYDFTLQAVEDNTQSARFGAARTINKRVDTLGALGSNQVVRDVSRNFRLQDDFVNLARRCGRIDIDRLHEPVDR